MMGAGTTSDDRNLERKLRGVKWQTRPAVSFWYVRLWFVAGRVVDAVAGNGGTAHGIYAAPPTVGTMKNIPSILIIDDNPQVLKTLSQVLLALGVKNVTETASAEAALDILKKKKFEMILADYRLEGMDGVQFIEKLRDSGDSTPVLLISGASNLEGIVRAFRQPNVDFFNKPFRMVELLGAMDRLTVPRPDGGTRAVA